MDFTVDFLRELVNKVDLTKIEEEADKDLLWCVTRIRTRAFMLFGVMGLDYAKSTLPSFDILKPTFDNMWYNLMLVAAHYPEEVKYSEDKVETPRLDILNGIVDTFNGLQSDGDTDGSMRELARIVATNEDSSHEHLGYPILMGIMSRIIVWAYPDVDMADYLSKLFA